MYGQSELVGVLLQPGLRAGKNLSEPARVRAAAAAGE
jgi:hypothetical protein